MRRGILATLLVALLAGSPGCDAGWMKRDTGANGADAAGAHSDGALKGRNWLLHVPPGVDESGPTPLLLVFHGGHGNGARVRDQTGFDRVADQEGFIVVYPDALDEHWNDGRKTTRTATSDVEFVAALIDHVSTRYAVDSQRIYAAGISNGGMMTQRLACEMGERIAAFASVVANLPVALSETCKPATAVPILLIYGMSDPIMPPSGGDIRKGRKAGKGGTVLSAEQSAAFWASSSGCDADARRTSLPDRDPGDGTRVERRAFGGCDAGAQVEMLAIDGGGHAWPGARQKRLAKRLTGPASQDIDASPLIWGFVSRYRLAEAGP